MIEPPPLPEVEDLVAKSEWIRGRADLDTAMLRWNLQLKSDRERITDEGAKIAKPRLNFATVHALVRTQLRFLWFAIASGIAALIARVRGRDVGSPAIRRATDLVRAGGPAYVKAGQFITTAKGVLPDEWIDAFAWCRDEVPALPPGTAEQEIANAFGRPVTELFEWFAPEPCAAASIAQVHPARLKDGTEVMVKVQRPGLRQEFEVSIRAMAVLAAAADRFSKRSRIANLPGFVELFAQLVLEELDFRLEAMNMVEIGLATEDAKMEYCKVPRPIPDLVTPNVLVMEKVPGIRYTDAAKNRDLDGHRLVRLAIQGVLEHALVYGVFHGDLHAGNVLIDEEGNFSLVDFGISGRVGARERAALVRMMLSMASEDTSAMVAAVAEFGALPPGFDLDQAAREFDVHAQQLRELADKPLDELELDFSTLTDQFGEMIRLLASHRFRVPKDLVLFSKNLLYLNGLAAAVAPDINLMAEIEPVMSYFLTKYPQEMSAIAFELLSSSSGLGGLSLGKPAPAVTEPAQPTPA